MTLIGIALVALLSGLLVLFLWEERRETTGQLSLGSIAGLWRGSERRRYPRIKTAVTVRYEILTTEGGGQWRQVHSHDDSAGGMCLRLYERLAAQTRLRFEIRLPRLAEPIRGTGEVRWTQDEARTGTRRTFLTGVQFLQLTPDDLNRLLQTLTPASHHRHRPHR